MQLEHAHRHERTSVNHHLAHGSRATIAFGEDVLYERKATGELASPSQQEDGSRHGHLTWSAGTGDSGTIEPGQDRTTRRGRRCFGTPRTRGPALESRRIGHSTTSSSPIRSVRHLANMASRAGPTGVGSPSRHASTWALTTFSTSFSSARWAAMSWRPGLVWRRPRLLKWRR